MGLERTPVEGRLQGRRALVTGAAGGIGVATVERFRAEGARVAPIDIEDADVTDEAAVERAVEEAVTKLGGLDIVVANAGIQLTADDARVDALDASVWRRTVEVNLTGAFLTAKYGARALLASGGGAIVFVGSPTGFYGIAPGLDAYSASKGGVNALVPVLAADFAADGVRVNGVLPGMIDTPMNRSWLDDPVEREASLRAVPMRRAGSAAEVANVIAFLASDEASYVTGALWSVDGGLTAV